MSKCCEDYPHAENCWGHGRLDCCVIATCENCDSTIPYGAGLKICETCSIKLKQCQRCRGIATWNPDKITTEMERRKSQLPMFYPNLKDLEKAEEKYTNIITGVKNGTITCNRKVIELANK